MRIRSLAGAVAALALVFGAGLLAAAIPLPAAAQAHAPAAVQQVTLYVLRGKLAPGLPGVPGPDGKTHDAFVPASFVVHVGQPVKVTVINLDEGLHSFTAPGLGLNVTIRAGKETPTGIQPVTTAFTFLPKKPGVYRWYCVYPCDKGAGYWAMGNGYGGPGKEGFMAGYVVVLP